jgi:hypothetical protein
VRVLVTPKTLPVSRANASQIGGCERSGYEWSSESFNDQ